MDFDSLPTPEETRNLIMNALTEEEKYLIKHGKVVIDTEKLTAYYDILYTVLDETEGKDVRVGHGVFEPFPYSWFITISGKEVNLSNLKAVSQYCDKISNIEIFSNGEDEVALTLTFNGIKSKTL